MKDMIMLILAALLIMVGAILVSNIGQYRNIGIGLIVSGVLVGLISAKVFKISFI